LGVFEFVLVLVLITTAGKVASQRMARDRVRGGLPGPSAGDLESLREGLEELNGRVVRLEEERDFYKAWLDAPERTRALRSPEAGDREVGPPEGS